jgi:hypothetical protein
MLGHVEVAIKRGARPALATMRFRGRARLPTLRERAAHATGT